MKTNFLDRMTDIANEAIEYIENQKGEIIFPKNDKPIVSVMVDDTYLLDCELDCITVTVERYNEETVYATNGGEYSLSELDIYGVARLADAISELKDKES